jgi:gliding motility-associated-like protein
MRKLLLLSGILWAMLGFSQNPATTLTLSSRNITLPCNTNCVSLSVQAPHIKQTTGYVITNPTYIPFAYTTPGGTEPTEIYVDDRWSNGIELPFGFCYYGNNFSALAMGSNSAITFDPERFNTSSGYVINAGGTIPNTSYAPNMIFGPYHDIDPSDPSANKKIEWRVEGTAPNRRFIASYNDMPYFGSSCTTPRATHQMVLYEGTGIVEVYIKDKPNCTSWNGGRTILGMQDGTQTNAIAAAGKNATVWGTAAIDSCWRFIPSRGTSRYLSGQLLVNNVVVYNADTSTLSAGVLNLNFPNICPTADSTTYVLRIAYDNCDPQGGGDIVYTDTIVVKRLKPTATAVKTDPTCSPNGTITVTAAGGTPNYQYSINNGTNYQASNTFTGLAGGTYTVIVRDNLACTSTAQTITLNASPPVTQQVSKIDANCTTTGSITITPGGGGTPPFQYSINGGSSYQSSSIFTGLAAGTYNVITRNVATQCTSPVQQVVITFTNNLIVSQIPNTSICRGASFTPQVTGNAASYSWSPTTAVSNPSIANPVLTPQQTTNYILTATLGTCTVQRTVTVTVFEGATANAGPDFTILIGDIITLQGTASVGTYLWTPATGLSSATILTPTANPAVTTTYVLQVTSPQGCLASDNVTVTVIPYCVKPMEAFTPNGDGINDLWLLTNGTACLTNIKAQVFNRYGSKVFESNNYQNNWNGMYKGKPLPDGTYYYIITFKLINGQDVLLKQKTNEP